jgi:hypothetical protein
MWAWSLVSRQFILARVLLRLVGILCGCRHDLDLVDRAGGCDSGPTGEHTVLAQLGQPLTYAVTPTPVAAGPITPACRITWKPARSERCTWSGGDAHEHPRLSAVHAHDNPEAPQKGDTTTERTSPSGHIAPSAT